MPNCAGQLDQKLDKNGDVAGFYTNLTDGPNWPRIQQSTTSDAQYCQSLAAFKREFDVDLTLKWICHDHDSYLDLDGELVSLNPA